MLDYRSIEQRLSSELGLTRRPIAIAFGDTPPAGDTPLDPDVVMFCGLAARVMLLQEAAIGAGVASSVATFGRPTCMAVPASLASGVVMSTGCVGNRVYEARRLQLSL